MLADCLPRADANRGAEQFGTLVHLTTCAVRQRGSSLSAIRTSSRSEPRTIANHASDESAHGIGNLFDSDPASVQTLRRFRSHVGSRRTSLPAASWVERFLGEAASRSCDGASLPSLRASSSALGSAQVNLGLRLVAGTTKWGVPCAPNGCDALRLFLARTTRPPDETRHTGWWGMAILVEGPATPPPTKGQVP